MHLYPPLGGSWRQDQLKNIIGNESLLNAQHSRVLLETRFRGLEIVIGLTWLEFGSRFDIYK